VPVRKIPPVFSRGECENLKGVRILDASSIDLVAKEVVRRGANTVWVDGYSGAGKSSFAGKLAFTNGWQHLQCDGLIAEGQDSPRYVDHIDRERLCTTLKDRSTPVKVVDGVCVQEVAELVGHDGPCVSVYILRASQPTVDGFLWHDELEQEAECDDRPWLLSDILRYHRSRRPHETADFVFVRIE